MATAGLIIRNDDGYIQITDQVPNFVYMGKGTVYLDGTSWILGSVTFGSHATISLPDTLGYPPVLAFRCDTDIVLYRTRLVSGNWVYDLVSEFSYTKTDAIDYYIFQPCPNTVPETFGLEVRKADGTLAFHSGYRPIVIKDVRTQAVYGTTGSTFSTPSGTKAAIIPMSWRYTWTAQIPTGAWDQFLTCTSLKTSSSTLNSVVIRQLQHGVMRFGTNFGFGAGESGQWAIMAIDVTNL